MIFVMSDNNTLSDSDDWIQEHIEEFRKSERGKNTKSGMDRNEELAKRRGFKSYSEYQNYYIHNKEKCLTYYKNMDCSLWLGVKVAENILPEIYENVILMPFNNRGFDALCSKGYKIDVKSSCILKVKNKYLWEYLEFDIDHNETADYFLCICFDNRKDLNVLYMWLIKSDEIIRGRKLSDFKSLRIMNSEIGIGKFRKYELSDDLHIKAREVCKRLKKEMIMR